jgi:hypothetical protein
LDAATDDEEGCGRMRAAWTAARRLRQLRGSAATDDRFDGARRAGRAPEPK